MFEREEGGVLSKDEAQPMLLPRMYSWTQGTQQYTLGANTYGDELSLRVHSLLNGTQSRYVFREEKEFFMWALLRWEKKLEETGGGRYTRIADVLENAVLLQPTMARYTTTTHLRIFADESQIVRATMTRLPLYPVLADASLLFYARKDGKTEQIVALRPEEYAHIAKATECICKYTRFAPDSTFLQDRQIHTNIQPSTKTSNTLINK